LTNAARLERDRGKIYANLAKRRAAKLQATPRWADLEKIVEVFRNCPQDMHVDHIVPLMGKLVCGLHIHNNLQYLTGPENLEKSNKWEPWTDSVQFDKEYQ